LSRGDCWLRLFLLVGALLVLEVLVWWWWYVG
jgi:hypothetical protein